jgi:alpha-L-fucosidase 2
MKILCGPVTPRNDSPSAKDALPLVRKLTFEGKYKEAEDIVNEKFFAHTSDGMPYQTVGNFKLNFFGHENYTGYHSELDLKRAVETSAYTVNGIRFTTNVFASYPDQVIVFKISADKASSLSFSAALERPAKNIATRGNDELIMSGTTGDFEKVKGNVLFTAKIKIITSVWTLFANFFLPSGLATG